ncbi:MAG: DM13 domain-containing protein [Cellvibrionaceae bacterium]
MKNIIISLVLFVFTVFSINHSVADNTAITSGSLKGDFSSWGKPSLQGDWRIVQEGNKTFLELDENFKAKKGPDVKIFLSPTESSNIDGNNAVKGSLFIKLISTFEGKARIELPTGVDLTQYKSLVFHCEEYSKLWGSSPL